MQRFAFAGAIAAVGVLGQGIISPVALAGFDPAGLINPEDSISAGDYSDCASDLQDSGIEAAQAVDVCASAFNPDQVANCVTGIQGDTSIIADAALGACLRVRRPEELSECVVDVDSAFDQQFSNDALAYCTRSLLPSRFSACVAGVQDAVQVDPRRIMNECIQASSSAADLFIPGLDGPATVPVTMPQVDLDSLEP